MPGDCSNKSSMIYKASVIFLLCLLKCTLQLSLLPDGPEPGTCMHMSNVIYTVVNQEDVKSSRMFD